MIQPYPYNDPFTQKIISSFAFIFQEDPPAGVSGAPCDNNIMQWNAVIFGPADTPFEDGTFKLTISKFVVIEMYYVY